MVNRISNPALHFQLMFTKEYYFFNYIDVGIEHRSDGQTTEIDWQDENGDLRTQVAYENNDYEYFDGISRGANYVSFTIGNRNQSNFSWEASVKAYWHQDSEVNWGRLANQEVEFSDYDLVNLSANYTREINWWKIQNVTLAAKYRFGKEFTDTDSIELSLLAPLITKRINLPIFFKAHFGPMETLSNYTRSVTNFSLGFALSF